MAQNNSNKGNRPENFVKISLIVSTQKVEGEEVIANVKYSAAGKPYATFRAFAPQGQNEDGSWKPAMNFTVKAFSKSEDMSPEVALAAELEKGAKIIVSGRLAMSEWTGRDEAKHQSWEILASKIDFPESGDGDIA